MKEQVCYSNEKNPTSLFLRTKRGGGGGQNEYPQSLVEMNKVLHCNILITILMFNFFNNLHLFVLIPKSDDL